jgi:hypothetical protein
VFEFNSVGFLRPAWADARVLAGTGSRAMMFKHKWVSASESRHEPASALRARARVDASMVAGAKPAPFLLARIKFSVQAYLPGPTSWTSDGLIRQAHLGMREDKSAKSVIVETPASPPNL